MAEKSKKTDKNKEKVENLKKKIKQSDEYKKKESMKEAQELIATRSKIERDYEEDKILVKFYTSPETLRKVYAKRPNNKEMITIMMLSAQAAKFEGSTDPEGLQKMVEIYERLSTIAANLSVDEDLDEEFWDERVSFSTLQNFITELITESQRGHSVSDEEMKKFR
jgi:hypothetical protein